MDETTDGPASPQPAGPLLDPIADPVSGTVSEPLPATAPPRASLAFFQVVAVSGLPTQVFLVILLRAAGLSPIQNGDPALQFFAIVGFLDTALVGSLILAFLGASRESPKDVFVGARPAWREGLLGFAFIPVMFLGVLGVVLAIRQWLPSLHNVDLSPLHAFLRTPLDAAVFLVVAIVAGGVREELQRGFILHRFDQRLGGIGVGLVVFSAFFGLFHLDQGADVAVAIGLLGLVWGIIYARRRSSIFAMVNHAGFNALQVGQVMLARAMGVG